MTTPESAFEELSLDECLALLASFTVGRVALPSLEGNVLVVPVNYVLDGDVVVFRSDPGEKLDAIHGRSASFQIDFIDPYHHTGWSVLVQGTAHRANHGEVAHLEIESWVGGEKQAWVKVIPRTITGRRLALRGLPLDSRGYL